MLHSHPCKTFLLFVDVAGAHPSQQGSHSRGFGLLGVGLVGWGFFFGGVVWWGFFGFVFMVLFF